MESPSAPFFTWMIFFQHYLNAEAAGEGLLVEGQKSGTAEGSVQDHPQTGGDGPNIAVLRALPCQHGNAVTPLVTCAHMTPLLRLG